MAAKKKPDAASLPAPLLRGPALLASALAAIEAPKPLAPAVLDRLRLPNGEPISPTMRALLAIDAAWLDAPINEEDATFEVLDLDDAVARVLGEEVEPLFEEAFELLGDDCIIINVEEEGELHVLYVGNPDDEGEYPVITLTFSGGAARVSGFAPFDVWLARDLGMRRRTGTPGELTDPYRAAAKELARRNGDGRTSFTPEPRVDDENEGGAERR